MYKLATFDQIARSHKVNCKLARGLQLVDANVRFYLSDIMVLQSIKCKVNNVYGPFCVRIRVFVCPT